jgi:hypothetical protein
LRFAVGNELGELLVEQLVFGLEAGDKSKRLLKNFAKREAAVNGGGAAELLKREKLFGFVENLTVDVIENVVPFSGLDVGGDSHHLAQGMS